MISLLLAVALSCPAVVVGSVEIYAKVYYLHADPSSPGLRYTVTSNVLIITNDTVYIHAEGNPVAAEWYSRPYGVVTKAGFELVKTCGEVPDPIYPFIFANGFEAGDADAWSAVIGGGGCDHD
jgi:hypothetical protein